MSFFCATDDFCNRTLAAIEGSVRKLTYIAGLRTDEGNYRHWGLERLHGPDAAHAAMADSHSKAWLKILRSPLPELLAECQQMEVKEREDLLSQLQNIAPPDKPCGGEARHFSSIVLALQLVFRPQNARKAA